MRERARLPVALAGEKGSTAGSASKESVQRRAQCVAAALGAETASSSRVPGEFLLVTASFPSHCRLSSALMLNSSPTTPPHTQVHTPRPVVVCPKESSYTTNQPPSSQSHENSTLTGGGWGEKKPQRSLLLPVCISTSMCRHQTTDQETPIYQGWGSSGPREVQPSFKRAKGRWGSCH